MLYGSVPFESDNISALMKYKISGDETLTFLHQSQSNVTVPLLLSNLVNKLLEKDVGKRYQCVKGLLYNLILISSMLNDNSNINAMELGRFDCSDKFSLSEKLYEREDEFKLLTSALEKVKKEGFFECFLVEGDSGIGKSHFVMELVESVFSCGGFLIRRKYDKQQAVEPYSAILQVLKSLFAFILMEDSITIDRYRDLILTAIGEESKLLTDIILNLRLIIGERQQVVPADIIAKDIKNHFTHVLCSLFKSICISKHPIVFVLDNLQWADTESLELMAMMISDPCLRNLLFVGIY